LVVVFPKLLHVILVLYNVTKCSAKKKRGDLHNTLAFSNERSVGTRKWSVGNQEKKLAFSDLHYQAGQAARQEIACHLFTHATSGAAQRKSD